MHIFFLPGQQSRRLSQPLSQAQIKILSCELRIARSPNVSQLLMHSSCEKVSDSVVIDVVVVTVVVGPGQVLKYPGQQNFKYNGFVHT